ncbi:MAG: hypothetical protein ACYDEH_02425 [Acidimicrobiales bacterium]
MAKSAAGKWVSRVGSSGGGRSYKKSRPSNFYGAIVVIVVLGLAATVLARYEYQNPSAGSPSTPPTIGTTWYAALSIDDCGTPVTLAPNPSTTGGFTLEANNVIKVSPVTKADAGNNATLAQFTREYTGLLATSTELSYPHGKATTTLKNGATCAPKTKYAGKVGQVSYAYWSSLAQKKPTVTTDPSTIKFSQYVRVTMAFLPSGVTPPAPSKSTVTAMVQAAVTPSTTTTLAPATTTTAKSSTSVTTTTAKSSTSSTSVTTTTKPKG